MAILGTNARAKLKNIIGAGWKFPFSFDSSGGVSKQGSDTENDSIDQINQSLKVILGTILGERVIRRHFGSMLYLTQDEPIDQFLIINIRRYVIDALERYERRITLLDNIIDTSEKDSGIVKISILYQIIRTQRRGNYVYPFYLTLE